MNNNENNNGNNNGSERIKELESRILVSKGHALLDHEIMKLFLRLVHNETHASIVAKEIIGELNSIARILGCDMDKLKIIKGVTNSTMAMIFCVKETLIRVLREKLEKLPIINNWEKLIECLKVSVGYSSKENLRIIYLDKKYHVITEELHDVGSVNEVPLSVREVIKKALFKGATSIVIAHNHPHRDPAPSTKGSFTSINALYKQVYCAIKKVEEKWTMSVQNWALTVSQLNIFFPGRLKIELN